MAESSRVVRVFVIEEVILVTFEVVRYHFKCFDKHAQARSDLTAAQIADCKQPPETCKHVPMLFLFLVEAVILKTLELVRCDFKSFDKHAQARSDCRADCKQPPET